MTCVESCQIYRPRLNPQGLLELRKQPGKCVHYYHYFNDPQVGFGYVRVQSWFPFTVHLGLNGRTWLYQQLRQHGHAFRHRDNLLAAVDDWPRAQALLDEQLHTDWPALLDRLAAPCQPLWDYLRDVTRVPYYWMTEQSEWATDVLFRDPRDLAAWYPRWLRHGIEGLSCKDVMRFLGRQVPEQGYGPCCGRRDGGPPRTAGGGAAEDVVSAQRPEDVRQGGSGVACRDDHQPAGRLPRLSHPRKGAAEGTAKSWQQMRKGVADLGRRGEVSGRVNERLLESLAGVKEPTPLGKLVRAAEPAGGHGRGAAGAGVARVGGGGREAVAGDRAGGLPAPGVPQPGRARGVVRDGVGPGGATAAGGGGDAAAGAAAGARADREGAEDAPLPAECVRPSGDDGAGDGVGGRCLSLDGSGLKSSPEARIWEE